VRSGWVLHVVPAPLLKDREDWEKAGESHLGGADAHRIIPGVFRLKGKRISVLHLREP